MGKLARIPRALYSEVVAGSRADYVVANELKQAFIDLGVDSVFMQPVSVMSWGEEECFLELDSGAVISCRALPYTLASDVEGNVVFGDYLGRRIRVDKPVSGGVVVIGFPDDPDDAKFVYLKLLESGARAIVFYDMYPGRYRRIVITGVRGFSFSKGAPPLIPLVSVRKEDFLQILRHRPRKIRVYVRTRVMHGSVGYNVVARVNSRSDDEILITAHHDHWFSGFSDNNIGVNTLLELAYLLREKKLRRSIVFISFTAEESGAPGYAGWYWSWGSRCYIADRNDSLSSIFAVLNIDAVYTRPFHVALNPVFYRILVDVCRRHDIPMSLIELDSPYFDSFMFTVSGIPALTVHTMPEMQPVYHTTLDDGAEVSIDVVASLNKFVEELVLAVDSSKHYDLSGFADMIEGYVGNTAELMLEARLLITRLKRLARHENIGINRRSVARRLTRALIKPIASYVINGEFRSVLVPEIYAIALLLSLDRDKDIYTDGLYIAGEEKQVLPEVNVGSMGSTLSDEARAEILTAFMESLRRDLVEVIRVVDEAVGEGIKHYNTERCEEK